MRLRQWMVTLTMCTNLIVAGCGGVSSVRAAEDAQGAVEKTLAVEQSAWNGGDSVTYAGEYTSDADFINIRGQVFSGQTEVQQQHAKIFAGPFHGSTVSIVVRRFTLLTDRIALVDTDQTVTGFGGLPPGVVATSPGTLVTHFKYVAVRQSDGSWKFSSGQNTTVLPN